MSDLAAWLERHPNLQIEYVDPAHLRPDELNPRRLDRQNRARLRGVLDAFGFVLPVLARREDAMVVGGHQRLTLAIERGDATVPVVYLDGLSDADARLLNIALNNREDLGGEFDTDMLGATLALLREVTPGLVLAAGFDEDVMAGHLGHATGGPLTTPLTVTPSDVSIRVGEDAVVVRRDAYIRWSTDFELAHGKGGADALRTAMLEKLGFAPSDRINA